MIRKFWGAENLPKWNTEPHQNFTGPYKKAQTHWVNFKISDISNVNQKAKKQINCGGNYKKNANQHYVKFKNQVREKKKSIK